jgi:hypothetical protein
MLRIHFAYVLAAVTALGFTGVRSAQDPVSYRDARYGFSFAPPAFEDDADAPAVTLAYFHAPQVDGFSANVNIQRQAFARGMKAYVEMSQAQFKAAGIEVQSSRPRQVGKRDAHEFVYSGDVGGTALKFHGLAVDDGEHVVLVTCTAPAKTFDKYAAQFDASLASFKFDE